MRAGLRRDLVQVERRTEKVDDYGNVAGGWALFCEEWADFRPTPGRERVAAGAVEATATATVRFPNVAPANEIRAGDRLQVRGETWNVRSRPIPAGMRREYVELVCETGVAS